MNKKHRILIPGGIAAIIILVVVQFYVIKDLWFDKDVMFDLKYKLLSQEAMEQLSRFSRTDGFENALELLNNYAKDIMTNEMNDAAGEEELAKLKEEALAGTGKILNELENLSPYLRGYFQRQGSGNEFTRTIEINYLQFIDFDRKLEIYVNPAIFTTEAALKEYSPERPASRILVSRFFREDNFYRISFSFYIDFSDKQRMVFMDVSAYLALSILSILAVVVIFITAFRNLMEEKRLSSLKTDFINNMTHEIKTPLSTITVAGKTLEMEKIRADENKILETARLIGKQSVHLNQLINLILEISMWERTQFQLDRKEVAPGELLHDIVESFRTGNNNHASITEDYDFRGRTVRLDVVYFTTMINNLLSNAVKYSVKEPVIKVEGRESRDGILISITDNGVGIGKQDLKHVFDKFYRVSQGNIHKTKGLGLGLYYVRRIAEAHGGTVTVTSKPGEGSSFAIFIPN